MSCEVYDLFACIVTAPVTTFARVKNSYGGSSSPSSSSGTLPYGDAEISWRIMLQIYLSASPEADLLFKRLEMTYLGNLLDWDVKQAAFV
jgi:hypothetical protein